MPLWKLIYVPNYALIMQELCKNLIMCVLHYCSVSILCNKNIGSSLSIVPNIERVFYSSR